MDRAWTRRAFLGAAAAGAAALLAARRAWALGDSSRLDVVELDLPGGTVARPDAWIRLLYEVQQTTSVECVPRVVRLAPEDPALFDHPFGVLAGNGELPALEDEAAASLTRYLQYGGFLLVDDATGVADSAFDRSVRRLCARLFPTRPLAPLPTDHAVYRSFFLVRRPVGRVDAVPWLEGVTIGEMTPLVYCRNDLSGALERGPDGRDRLAVEPGGAAQRREAVKLGVNLVVYALTSDYKKDATHVRALLREGRIEE